MKGLIFTYALTYGGAVLSFYKPIYGLLAFVCFGILRPEGLWHWSVPAGNYSRILAICFLLGWALHGFGGLDFGRAKGMAWMLVLFWCWAAVSAYLSADPEKGYVFLENQGKIYLPIIVGITLVKTQRDLYLLVWTIALSLGYLAFDLNESYFSGFNRLETVGFAGMDNNSITIGLVCGVGFTFFLGLMDKPLRMLLAFFASALLTHAVFFSFSRGGMLGLAVVGAVAFLFLPKRPKYMGFFAVGCVVALAMVGPEIWNEFTSSFDNKGQRDEAAESRLVLWEGMANMMLERPAFGFGPDQMTDYTHIYTPYPKGMEGHSTWLQTGSEVGFPGLLFFAGFYVLLCRQLVRLALKSKTADDSFPNLVPQMILASLAGFIVAAQFVTLEGLEVPYYIGLVGCAYLNVVDKTNSLNAVNLQ